jgi:hypothetical protein
MKRILVVISTVTLLLTLASLGEAWQVNIKNSCKYNVEISVLGEHLFWKQVDCKVTVAAGQTGVCVMPGAICPVRIDYSANGAYLNLNCNLFLPSVCCCWDLNTEAINTHAEISGGTGTGTFEYCVLQLR